MRTANPALNKNTFNNLAMGSDAATMTIQGTATKTTVLLLLLVLAASWTWKMTLSATDISTIMPWMYGGLGGGVVFAFITIFKKTWAPVTSPIYAVLEGLFLGALSALFEAKYPGIVMQAVALTFGTMFALLMAYKSRLIKVTENFKLGIVAATGGIMIIYLVSFVLGFFGTGIPYIHESGLIGIGFSLFVVVIAALNLVLDFDFIENGADRGAPKYMEWYGAFGLLVTLVWLYIEILRLLSKIRSR
ncbi:MAG: Bax inhibitor-1/YccA family protein [Deltaproteobacteria bacterium]|nr:Bax inhibitor-1/YccA family protein [Deltaproteobacteria bacterium]